MYISGTAPNGKGTSSMNRTYKGRACSTIDASSYLKLRAQKREPFFFSKKKEYKIYIHTYTDREREKREE